MSELAFGRQYDPEELDIPNYLRKLANSIECAAVQDSRCQSRQQLETYWRLLRKFFDTTEGGNETMPNKPSNIEPEGHIVAQIGRIVTNPQNGTKEVVLDTEWLKEFAVLVADLNRDLKMNVKERIVQQITQANGENALKQLEAILRNLSHGRIEMWTIT